MAWTGKGIAPNDLNKSDEAIKVYEKEIEINPQNSYCWLNKGFSLVELKNPNEAIRAFDYAFELD